MRKNLMMMSTNKKLAATIIKGLGKSSSKDPASDSESFVDRGGGKKEPVVIEEDIKSSDGMEAAMSKFILAVKAGDATKAVEAMCEFLDMQSGEQYPMESTEEV